MVTLVIDHTAKSAAPGCHEHRSAPPAAPLRDPVAMPPVTVNGIAIPRKAIAAEVQNFPARNPGDGWRAVTRALVIRELLLQEARRLEVSVEPRADEDGRIETAEDALIRALIDREVRVPKADEATLRRFYENNYCRFVTPALYEADHILIAARRDDLETFTAAREKAASLAAVLATEPERFSVLARDFSDCPSAALGGSLGQIGPGDTTAEFEAALAGLSLGQISSPVETRYGVHIIRLARRIEGRPLSFDVVRKRIEVYLEEHVRHQAITQYIALLIGRAEVRGIALEGATSPLVQ
ncbi:peptidylprolyl isomerase [Hyphomicrobium sp. MC1]|uniref:peptidylprolyl isomerase n=1 Tax=Hyphomicrobium sp. (strain MC1) TaxID=717785 RepID=UPI000213E42B|nr:peptidylprolyl isomerase [Hyphomicrobium sp. MC1]CCB66465.1 PpiC-type peptidyl-prolyl cis-trans isomerase [Hyphomicrobium sp. MC1]